MPERLHAAAAEVIPVSLNNVEQRTLGRIADELAGSAPKLTSMLTVFNRLTSGEEMPGQPYAPGRHPGARSPGSRFRKRAWPITAVALTVITAIVMTVLLTLTGHGSGEHTRCLQPWSIGCPRH
jgi:hypothetical protein